MYSTKDYTREPFVWNLVGPGQPEPPVSTIIDTFWVWGQYRYLPVRNTESGSWGEGLVRWHSLANRWFAQHSPVEKIEVHAWSYLPEPPAHPKGDS